MFLLRIILVFSLSLSIIACKDEVKTKRPPINLKMKPGLRMVNIDTIQKRLDLPNNKTKKLKSIQEKYQKLIRDVHQNKSTDNLEDLVRRRSFETKVLLGDSLKIEFDKLLLEKSRNRKAKRK